MSVAWRNKVFQADGIWASVREVFEVVSVDIPRTPRRPDVRVIVNNMTGVDQVFPNPAGHAGDKAEYIPSSGSKTAAMIMPCGESLREQYDNARQLVNSYNLLENGLIAELAQIIAQKSESGLIREAYGPAPFEEQVSKLAPTPWREEDGQNNVWVPEVGEAGAFGVRPPAEELVFRVVPNTYVAGTTTNAELVHSEGICIVVAQDWQTHKESTRPIVSHVARGFYGAHFSDMPVVYIDNVANIERIDVPNVGTIRGSVKYDFEAPG